MTSMALSLRQACQRLLLGLRVILCLLLFGKWFKNLFLFFKSATILSLVQTGASSPCQYIEMMVIVRHCIFFDKIQNIKPPLLFNFLH